MQDGTLTLTGGWAIFAITCIIYFIANIVYGFGLLIEKQIKKKRTKRIETNETDWQHYRIQASIAAMQGMLANETHSASVGIIAKEDGKSNTEVMAEAAVQLADALIAELQKKQD
jgi:hypothetical protein